MPTITYKTSVIHYSWLGAGHQLLLCLHGYGESAASFHFLCPHLPKNFSLLAIDLPFHGHTDWREGLSFTTNDLVNIIDAIRIKHTHTNAQLTLLGFSMGGRIALQLLQHIPEKINRVILLAPDGLKVNVWYWLSTQTTPGNKLFLYTMRHPQWFFYLLTICNRLRLINQSIYKFVRYYLHDSTARRLLYERWTCLNSIRPHLTSIKKIIHNFRVPVRLLYGKYDRIIRPERGEKFRDGIESFCTLQVIQAGHQLLQEKHVQEIIRLLQS
jgi:Predicted hydrolases or acyltransferases (alpha/beta hydrolase superfamily)